MNPTVDSAEQDFDALDLDQFIEDLATIAVEMYLAGTLPGASAGTIPAVGSGDED